MTDKELMKAAGEILKNESTAAEFNNADSLEDIKEIFDRNGSELTLSEVERIGVLLNGDELTEEDLNDVRGGMTREILMIGGVVAAIAAVGACRAAYLRVEKE